MKPTSILSYTLTPRQRESGIEVEILRDHRTRLFRKDETLRMWESGECPTCIEVQEAADRVLELDEHLFDFERQREVLDTMKDEYKKRYGGR